MKIAIMGAGLSGLSCAITLEKHGYSPVIYEINNTVGDSIPRAEIMLPAFNRPIEDEAKYLYDHYGIRIKSSSRLNQATFFSENKTADLFGKLGSVYIRGDHPSSYENQLLNQVHSLIIYNSTSAYETLKKEYTHVVIATGDPLHVNNLQSIRTDLCLNVRGATITGSFDIHRNYAWLDNTIAPKGFAFLTPLSKREATIATASPKYLRNGQISDDERWEGFLERISLDTGIDYTIIDEFQYPNLILSRCLCPKVGNTYFTGNCLWSMGPAFGIGQFSSILSGIYAALDICGKGDYQKLTKKLLDSYENSLVLRRVLEKLNNSKQDTLVGIMDQIFFNRLVVSKFNSAKYLSKLLRPFV